MFIHILVQYIVKNMLSITEFHLLMFDDDFFFFWDSPGRSAYVQAFSLLLLFAECRKETRGHWLSYASHLWSKCETQNAKHKRMNAWQPFVYKIL